MIRRVRQWWCSRQHDKGYRLHSWAMLLDGKGSIRCRRCGVVQEGLTWPSLPPESDLEDVLPRNGDEIMAEAMTRYRKLFR